MQSFVFSAPEPNMLILNSMSPMTKANAFNQTLNITELENPIFTTIKIF